MAELKTKKNSASVSDFISSVSDAQKKADSERLLSIFSEITGEKPTMWGGSIIGFGSYHYKSERSSQEGDWPLTGFSPRKQALTIYIMPGFEQYDNLMEKLGKYKTGKSCLYVKKLDEIDIAVLKVLIRKSVAHMKKAYS